MLDIGFIRNNPQIIKEGIRKKKLDMDVDELLAVDGEMRSIKSEVESLRAERNRLTKEIPKLQGDPRLEAVARVRSIKDDLSESEPKLRDLDVGFSPECNLCSRFRWMR